jgi:four helix bundle protein
MFDFEKLDIYRKAKVFNSSIRKLIRSRKFDRNTIDQLYRASFSIVLNIAEGSGRFSKRDRRNFFVIARSSVFECVAILDVLRDEGIILADAYLDHYNQAEEISKILFAMIRNLNVKV